MTCSKVATAPGTRKTLTRTCCAGTAGFAAPPPKQGGAQGTPSPGDGSDDEGDGRGMLASLLGDYGDESEDGEEPLESRAAATVAAPAPAAEPDPGPSPSQPGSQAEAGGTSEAPAVDAMDLEVCVCAWMQMDLEVCVWVWMQRIRRYACRCGCNGFGGTCVGV